MSLVYKAWIPRVLAVAYEAADTIMSVYHRKNYPIQSKADSSPVTAADLSAHQIIQQGLLAIDPTLPFLSEEGEAIPFNTRSQWNKFWLVDPLDGTHEFIQGSEEFTINIALIENHLPVLGVVVAPAVQRAYWAVRHIGAYMQLSGKEPVPIHTHPLRSPLKIIVSRRHEGSQPSWLTLIKRLGEHEIIYCGSSLKICLIAEGKVDLYPQMGLTSEWDTAAGQCILEEAGGQLIDLSGHSLQYNTRLILENPKFFALSNPDLKTLCCG